MSNTTQNDGSNARTSVSPWRRVQQIAAHFAVSPRAIYNACESGKLKHARFGKSIRIRIDDAESWASSTAEMR